MDATQRIEDSFYKEEEDSDNEQAEGKSEKEPLAVLKVFKNNHIPETEVPLYQGENVLGRDPTSCSVPLQARSVSSHHAIISISVFGPDGHRARSEATEALLWDLGSLNGTRKGRFKLTPHVRYALTDGDGVLLADLPCQYVRLKNTEHMSTGEKARSQTASSSSTEGETVKEVENSARKSVLPPVPVWSDEAKRLQQLLMTPKQPETTLVPESDSDSDGEKHGQREKRRIVASVSVSSDLSSPTCSTFLTPATKIIPESEDESSITPSPAFRFQKPGNDTEVSSASSKPDAPHFNIDSDTDVEDDDVEMTKTKQGNKAPVPAEAAAVNLADLHMDSDTDADDEEMGKIKSDPEASGLAPAKQDPVNPVALIMDSDTDVEEDEPVKTEAALLSGPAAVLEEKKEDAVSSALSYLESDTDVEEDEPVKTEAALLSGPAAVLEEKKEDAVSSALSYLESDTDVEEDEPVKTEAALLSGPAAVLEEKKEDAVSSALSYLESDTDVEEDEPVKTEAAPSSGTAAVLEEKKDLASSALSHLESDTDVEEEECPRIQDSSSHRAEFNINSDTDIEEDEETTKALVQPCEIDTNVSDAKMLPPGSVGNTDVEDDVTDIKTPTLAKETGNSQAAGERSTDARLDSPVKAQPAGALRYEFRLDSDTDVEEDEDKLDEKEQKCTEASVRIVHSSTPRGAGLFEEEKETQAFLSPSQLFKRPVLPSLLHPSVSPGGVSHTDDDFAVAETQSFVCDAAQADATLDETSQSLEDFEPPRSDRAPPLQLNLSDSSTNQMTEAGEHNQELPEEDWQLQATQLYAMRNVEASTKAGLTQLDLDATQAYTDPISQEDEEDEKKDEEGEGTQPLATPSHSSIIHSGTQLIKNRAQNENPSERDSNEKVGAKRRDEENVDDEMQADSHLSTADTLLIVRSPRREEQTQPYAEEIQQETEEQMSRAQEVQQRDEGRQSAQNEKMRLKNDDEREMKEHKPIVMKAKNDVEKDIPEDEKKREESETKVDEARAQPAEDDTIIETQYLSFKDKDEEGHEEEQLNEPSTSKGTWSAQCIKAEHNTRAAIAETLPMCEEEEEHQEEPNEPKNSRRPGRRKPKQSVESDKFTHVTMADTLPLFVEDNERQEEPVHQESEAMSTMRSSMRRQNVKAKPTKSDECPSSVTLPETQPICDEEEGQEEEPQSKAKSVRKSRRGKQIATVEDTQPLDADSTAETLMMEEKEAEPDGKRSLRGKAASGKGRGRGRAPAEKDGRGKKGKTEQDEKCEEEVDGGNNGRGRKSLRQKAKLDDKARLELVEVEYKEIESLKKQKDEEKSERLQQERKKEEEALVQLEREKSMRLEKKREEREERENRKLEERDRLKRERINQERKAEKEKEQIERETKEKEEKEKSEREKQLEKVKREQDEKDWLEQERIERENKEKEGGKKLDKEMRERVESERKTEEENDRLARENRTGVENKIREENEKQEKEMEQKEKTSKESNKDNAEKEQTHAPGKRKAVRKGGKFKNEEDQDVKEGAEAKLELEQELSHKQKQDCEEGSSKKQEEKQTESNAKPRQGRHTARKSFAPPAGGEDEGGPAKRTRSRSNSSNSVCSEQSTQDSLNEGRRRGRRTTKVETKQAAHSRPNSRSSERSSSSVATPNRGREAKRRKNEEVEEPKEGKQEERKQSPAVGRGRGRGRGGKHPGTNEIKVAGEAEKKEAEIRAGAAEDSVMSQSSSRGRKRGANISRAETPQPIPKTPRRSIAGPTHKVLFTGVADEDGEKVVVRLGGRLAKGVTDMTHLVTDKVRRTVKFLCAVARGVPIVTPDWLSKCGKEGSFLSPNGFLVKDVEQEKKFNFSLQDTLRVASSQPLLQGYEIHVTPSVKPEPAQMKEIITCCGARFLPKMPAAHKAQVVVVSCEEDRALCERARSLSFPVVSAEFLLTGILQQKADMQSHALALSPAALVPKPNARKRGK